MATGTRTRHRRPSRMFHASLCLLLAAPVSRKCAVPTRLHQAPKTGRWFWAHRILWHRKYSSAISFHCRKKTKPATTERKTTTRTLICINDGSTTDFSSVQNMEEKWPPKNLEISFLCVTWIRTILLLFLMPMLCAVRIAYERCYATPRRIWMASTQSCRWILDYYIRNKCWFKYYIPEDILYFLFCCYFFPFLSFVVHFINPI